jgi:hypothetical protein
MIIEVNANEHPARPYASTSKIHSSRLEWIMSGANIHSFFHYVESA